MEKIKLSNFIKWGLIFALTGEIFDNFIIHHRPYILLAVIIPIYILFFFFVFKLYERTKWSPIRFSFIIGFLGLFLIENLILKKFVEPWPIQIFMFSFWFSITSYPFLMVNKKYRLLLTPAFLAISIAIIGYLANHALYLTLALFQFTFWIVSAISNFFYLRFLGKQSP